MRDFFDRLDTLLDQVHALAIGVLIMFALGLWAAESWQRRKARR